MDYFVSMKLTEDEESGFITMINLQFIAEVNMPYSAATDLFVSGKTNMTVLEQSAEITNDW